jgi:hypothetical protein
VPDVSVLGLEVLDVTVASEGEGNGAVVIGLNGFVKTVNEAMRSSRPTS